MVEVVKNKEGAIVEISEEMTIRQMGSSKFIVLPEEFFSIGKLPWKTGEKPKVSLNLKDGFKVTVEAGAT
jgi:hypothetical protein